MAHGVAVRPVGIAGVPSAAVAETVTLRAWSLVGLGITSDWEPSWRARFKLIALAYWSHARFAEDVGGTNHEFWQLQVVNAEDVITRVAIKSIKHDRSPQLP